MAGANVLHLDDNSFDEQVIKSSIPVLVDFWAEWCGPCQLLGPTIDELAGEYEGKVKVAKVDIDAAQSTAARYGVGSIPTVMIFQNGEAVEKIVGARAKKDYQAVLNAKLGG
ncbi:MAG: thioredoxin [Phycisphaerae bacterium]